MAGKIKGIYKGFKSISQIFVAKEREMEIGQPTDVVHVAHIGGDHSSTISPRWMNEFKTGPNNTVKSTGNTRVSQPTARSSQVTFSLDSTQLDPIESKPRTKKMRNQSCNDLSNVMEKRKRRRNSTSVSESSSTKSRRLSKAKTTSTRLGSSSDTEI